MNFGHLSEIRARGPRGYVPGMAVRFAPGSTDAVLPAALNKRPSGVAVGELLDGCMEQWGGVRRYAADLYACFNASPEGGATQQRILGQIQSLIIAATQRRRRDPARPPAARVRFLPQKAPPA